MERHLTLFPSFKYVLMLVLGMAIALCTFIAMARYKPDLQFQPSSRVLVTAAHLGEIPGYMCVYADEDSDVGIYLIEDYVATRPPKNSRVSYNTTAKGTIASTSDGEFTFKPDDVETIVPGVSGSTVYYDGVPIGYISGWAGDGTVRCIFY